MKNLSRSSFISFLIMLSTFLLVYLLSTLNVNTVKLTPNEDAHTIQTVNAAKGGFNNNRIDINTASAEQLSMLPGVGKTIAEEIISYRQANGLFKSIHELAKVPGIGDKTIENISKYITVGGLS